MDFTVLGNIEAVVKDAAVKKMAALQRKLARKFRNIRIETGVVRGSAMNEIQLYADKVSADMIVMGTTGMTKMARLLMGSTTSTVIQHASCPVLCIPPGAVYKHIRKIVFATDLKEDNITAATGLSPFAKKFDAEIVFVFVDDRHLIHANDEVSRMTKKIRSRVKYPKISGFISKHTSITKGLEYFLKKRPADMLALFTHRKHFPQSLFNQSVTKLMSHQTNIPMLSLHAADMKVI